MAAKGKRYSAGAIFLQVVPVFANVQKAIEKEAEGWSRTLGDKMDKVGDDAGRRGGKAMSKGLNDEMGKGLKGAEAEFKRATERFGEHLESIPKRRLSNAMKKELKQIEADFERVKDLEFNVGVDTIRADNALKNIRRRLAEVQAQTKFDFTGDVTDLNRAIDSVGKKMKDATHVATLFEKRFKSAASKIAASLEGQVGNELDEIRRQLETFQDLKIGVDISGAAFEREYEKIEAKLAALDLKEVSPEVRMAAETAIAEAEVFRKKLDQIDNDKIKAEVEVDTDKAERALFGIKRTGEDVSNSFRSFNFVLLAAAGAGPALIPVLAAIAGGLLAIGPAAAVAVAGLAAVLVGFSGIGGALQALQAKDDAAAKTAGQSAKSQAASARAVARARESAADKIENALRRQADAQRDYARSIQDVKDAREALKEAEEAAKNDGKRLDLDIRSNTAAIDEAQIDVGNATLKNNSVQNDGSATSEEKAQATIDLEQAQIALEELRLEQEDLAAEKKKWDEEGIKGTDAVESAQDRLDDAIQRQKDSYRDLGEAARAVDEARRDGARQVADALAAQAEQMAAVNAQQANLDAAFEKLGPAGQEFALFLYELKKGFRSFRDDVQQAMLPGVQEAIEGFLSSGNAKIIREALVGLGGAFGDFAKALSVSFQGEAWTGFFTMLRDLGPEIYAAYGGAFIKLFEAIASIFTTAAPFALRFAQGLEKMMTAFADWAASKEGQDAILKFIGYVERIGPKVLDFFGSFIGAVGNLAVAMAPFGEAILEGLTSFLDFIANMDPKILGAIGAAIATMIIASQVAFALQAFRASLMALMSGALGPWTLLIVGLGLAFVYLYKTNDKFREKVDKAWDRIKKAIKKAWEIIKPSLKQMGEALKELWEKVLKPFFEFLEPILLWLVENIIPILAQHWANLISGMAWVISNILVPTLVWLGELVVDLWENVLRPTWDAIETAANWLWENVLDPVFSAIGTAWEGLMDGLAWVWNNVLSPVFDAIETGVNGLQTAFETVVDAIGTVWDTLQGLVATPINFILGTVLNDGLISGLNTIIGWVTGNDDTIGKITIPEAIKNNSFATGGVLPGYTPGRDVHSFVSPTGGRLNLSGGEAIMRPEWTAAMGSGYVDEMNALARRKGIKGVRQAMGMQAFAKGGVFNPLPGAGLAVHNSGYSHYAADYNMPGRADYGKHIHAYMAGLIKVARVLGDTSYGRYMDIAHDDGMTSRYAHMSAFAPNLRVGGRVAGNQWIGNVGDLGNATGPHLHFELMGSNAVGPAGAVGPKTKTTGESSDGSGWSIPGWVLDIVKDPLGAVKGWIQGPLDTFKGIASNPYFKEFSQAPFKLVDQVKDKMWSYIPGWVKTAAGWVAQGAGWIKDGVGYGMGVIGDAAGGIGGAIDYVVPGDGVPFIDGFKDGGILPYNGTMMYDNGGYLPPGLTTVVNLTGKPEPVFTHDQWNGIGEGGTGGGTLHYEPHFEGSNLTAEDVAGDMNFTFRRLGRGGKYGGFR